jgi:hypothetical protein
MLHSHGRTTPTHAHLNPAKKEEEESKGMMFGHQFKPKKKTQKGLHPPAPSSQDNDLLMHVNAGSISSF